MTDRTCKGKGSFLYISTAVGVFGVFGGEVDLQACTFRVWFCVRTENRTKIAP